MVSDQKLFLVKIGIFKLTLYKAYKILENEIFEKLFHQIIFKQTPNIGFLPLPTF